MKQSIKKLIAIGIIASSISALPIVGASASWKQNSNNQWTYDNISNGWIKDNNNWYFFKEGIMKTGWIQDTDGIWYCLNNSGEMLRDITTSDGYKLGSNGAWIQNNTITNNANSNNTTNTNLTNNVNNSKKSSSDITLNNTGSITNNTINNDINVNNTTDAENDYYKQLAKAQKERAEQLKEQQEASKKAKEELANSKKAYYEKELANVKGTLAEAKANLKRAESQKTIKNYEKQEDGTYQFVYSVDKNNVASCEKRVNTYQDLVDYYEKLVG